MKKIGFAICGSFCTFEKAFKAIEKLISLGYDVTVIMSDNAYNTDTRFGKASFWREKAESLTGQNIIHTLTEAEPIGPKNMFDVLITAPCTGNTLAKLNLGITDTPVTLAVKSHLRNERPVVLAVSTNDALSNSAKNIGALMNRKHVYFVPFSQDDPAKKPNSLIADFELIPETAEHAANGKQLQPIIIRNK